MIGQGVTGLTPTVRIRKDTGSFTATTNTPTEVGNGLYEVALTATECNCDIMAIEVTLPDGQFPAILTNEYLTTTGGATPAEIWGYAGGRTVTNTIPTAADNATAVWGAQSKEVTIATAQADTFATASSVANIATVAGAIKAKTDNLPASPAAVGSEMALTSAAISAVQNGLATSSELSALETHGDSSWATATGFATPSDLLGLSTFNAATDTVTINSTQAAGMATADLSGIPAAVWSNDSRTLTESALTAADVWSYSSRTLTASALTAQDVWEYSTRELTSSPTDISGLATSQDITDLQTHGDSNWNTATGFATPTNVSDAKSDIISAIPTDYAKPGNAMTLTSSTLASVVAGVWNYDNRELTQEIVSQVTAEDIASISIAVWSYVPRKLTSIVSDVIEPNK